MRKIRRNQKRQAKRRRFAKRTLAAGAAAAITLGAGAALNKAAAGPTHDAHQTPVARDADADLLADREESALGYLPFNPDQNRNLTLDGVELARRCAREIEKLPWESEVTDPNQTYKWSVFQFGLEICDVCGETVNMGHAGIVNPRLGLKVDCPFIATHYMAHGSFEYAGHYSGQPLHVGRIDVPLLARALGLRLPYDPNQHQLPLDYAVETLGRLAPDANDLDADLLADTEELAAALNLYDPDQDNDLTLDGPELAAQCAAVIELLPEYKPDSGTPEPNDLYKVNHWQRGLERCPLCGETVNMGWWTIVNPKLRLSYDAYEILLHYMTHGSFTYHGLKEPEGDLLHAARADVAQIVKLLEMPSRCGHLGTLYLPGHSNRDCKEDFKDLASLAGRWLDSTHPNIPPEPAMTYRIANCGADTIQTTAPTLPERAAEPPEFSVRVEGQYVYFHDVVPANCCPDEIKLEMTLEDNLITIFEKEYVTSPCRCYCGFPAAATLGPFDDGEYTLEVYLINDIGIGGPSTPHFVGTVNLTIGPEPPST